MSRLLCFQTTLRSPDTLTFGVRLLLMGVFVFSCTSSPVERLPFEPAGPNAAPRPSVFGPFPVGVRTVELLDTGRKKPDGTPRKLVTEIWYPAASQDQEGPFEHYDVRAYLTPEQKEKTAALEIPFISTVAVRDADVSSLGPFPVLLFSHGQGGVRWQSTYLTVFAASHGYVVAAPDHEGNTLGDALANQLSPTSEGVEQRPNDMRYVLTWLSRLKESDALYGKVDTSKVGLAGHSFGALTALRTAAIDKRVDVIVPQTPVDAAIAWFGLPQVTLDIPVMVQGSRLDQTLPWDEHVEPTWKALQRPKYLFELLKGGHFSYTDLCALDLVTLARNLNLPEAEDLEEVLNDGCGPQAPPSKIALPLVSHFAMALLNTELRASAASKLFLTQAEADQLGPQIARFTIEEK